MPINKVTFCHPAGEDDLPSLRIYTIGQPDWYPDNLNPAYIASATTPEERELRLAEVEAYTPDLSDGAYYFVFPEDITVSEQTEYQLLNFYGIFPFVNSRTHNIRVRYGDMNMVTALENLAKRALASQTPLPFGGTVLSHVKSLREITTRDPDTLEPSVDSNDLDYDTEVLDTTNTENLGQGFIQLPIQLRGTIGNKGQLVDGFSFAVTEVLDRYKRITLKLSKDGNDTEWTFVVPTEGYQFAPLGSGVQALPTAAGENSSVVVVGSAQYSININLPSAFTSQINFLKQLQQDIFSLQSGQNPAIATLTVTDEYNIVIEQDEPCYIANLAYGGSIRVPTDAFYIKNLHLYDDEVQQEEEVLNPGETVFDPFEGDFLPEGISFSIIPFKFRPYY